jgi:hypothetical protein
MEGRIDCADAHAGASTMDSMRAIFLAYPSGLETALTISVPP